MSRSSRSNNYVNRQPVRKLNPVIGDDHALAIQQGVKEYLQDICLAVLGALMEGELTELCGRRYEHKDDRLFTRHGYQKGSVTVLGGGKEPIEKPRARNVKTGKEAELKSYKAFSDKQVLDDRTLALVGSGVSMRHYEEVLEKSLRRSGVSASSVSRRVIRASQTSLEVFENRRWDKHRFVALLFDGVRVGRCMVVACVGVDLSGRKHVLGVHPGATESAIVCRDLIRKLIDRGLDVDGNYLFIIDGSKALRAAIKERFGKEAAFQRCQEHKIRDVQAYLPFKLKQSYRSKMQAAYNMRSYKQASDRLEKLRIKLSLISEQAERSLVEGLYDTLTLHRLGIWGGLKDSLRTTNIIESTFASLRRKTANVTNWHDEQHVNRWMAHGLLQIEQRYRTVPGHRTLTRLRANLKNHYTASQSTKA
jgi:putative transposase